MNINLAPSDLHNEQLLEELSLQLAASELPVRLSLELTEEALLTDLAHTRETLLRLAAAGAKIAIDDYGTGHSSLSRLARLPVDELKIDRLFVQAMLANPVDAAIVASTVGLAHSIGVPVVAEGVEDEATLEQIRELGCDKVQGYYFSRPLPPADLEQWLARRTT
jgi:EAL domain-containing protein (putative c-di-GMP-specific phosphodiesterase class I)